MVKKYLFLIISFIFHLAAIALIIYLAWPIGKWYLNQVPARGIDLWLSASYVSHLLSNFAFRFNGWKEIWYSGVPYFKDYPSLYFYLMIPFAQHFGLIPGILRFAVVALFAFTSFSYLLYYQLSKNRVLAVVLTLTTVFSANLYRPLVWAGGIPFWTTQAFFPLVLFLIVKFSQSQNYKWLLLAALAAGFGITGHPQNFFNVILPSAGLILLFWQPACQTGKKRFLDLLKFGGLTYLVALPQISQLALTSLITGLINKIFSRITPVPPATTGGVITPSETLGEIEKWTRAQFNSVWSDSHPLLWYLLAVALGVFILSLVLRKKRLKGLFAFVPFSLIAGLVVGSVFLYSRGIDLYISGWYKAFWPGLVGVATLIAFLWGEAKQALVEREFWQKQGIKMARWLGVVIINLVLVLVGYWFLLPSQKTTLDRLEAIDQFSSAFPEVLNVKTSPKDLERLKEELKPELMIDDAKDYRLYVIDATVNIWWGAVEEMPLTRGYVDPPLSTLERWGLFWLDSALGPTQAGPKSSLIEDWKTPEEVADNNLRFLLDWYATKYLEGNHVSASSANFASNVISDKLIEAEEKIEAQGGVVERYRPDEHWSNESKQFLNFYRIKNELVSPILIAIDSPAVLHIGGEDGYDTLTRFLGEVNLGPRKIVLARGPKFIDKVNFSDLTNFEAIILYKYDYNNWDKAWGMIDKYVEKGGKIFIDTGPEVKESDTTKLPAKFPAELPGIFPISRTVREDLGQDWEPQVASGPATAGINFGQFSPLIFDGGVWNVSHPISDNDLRDDTTVLLRHKGIPVVIEKTLGKGKIIWSGFNLPYHAIRDYNPQEAKFFRNLLAELVDLREKPVLTKGKFISPEERIIEVSGAKGVVFKEQAFAGWQAIVISNSKYQKLKIYKVGPSSPGFMYVRLPEGTAGKVVFKYTGATDAKLQSGVSLLVIILILDYLFGGRIFAPFLGRMTAPVRERFGKWWEKEDEY